MPSCSLAGKILRELGPIWTARPFGLETWLRSGMVRSRMPVSKWDFSSRDWLRSDGSSDPEQFKQSLVRDSEFFFKPGHIRRPERKRVSERLIACYLESGHTAHEWIRVGSPPDWHLNALDGTRVAGAMLVRAQAFSREERSAQAFWRLVEDCRQESSQLPSAVPDCICVKFGVRCSPNDRR